MACVRSTLIFFLIIFSNVVFAEESEKQERTIKFIPLPVYATLPNEGSTYGFMPVFMAETDERVNAIIAPSVTWNDISHINTTARFFLYPQSYEDITIQVTHATRVAREALGEWIVQPTEKGKVTYSATFHYKVDPFRRFFGLGKDSARDDESSYTLENFKTFLRVGYNVTNHCNAYISGMTQKYKPLDINVPDIQSPFSRFKYSYGLHGSTTVMGSMGARYDNRDNREYSTEGTYVDTSISGAYNYTPERMRPYGLGKFEIKQLWKERTWVYGATRFYTANIFGGLAPFYDMPSLGGSYLLRGFMLDRFVDRGAWTIDFEQRITPVILNVYGSIVHVRIDPFVSVGQVYRELNETFKRVQFTKGVGIRAYVPPNVVGRIDLAEGGPDLNIYVELGYSF